jgi:hypothetical protein
MSKEPITHLIIDTSSSSDDYNGDCDYALVPLSRDYVAELLDRMEIMDQMHRAGKDVWSLECWDCGPSYLRLNEKMETIRDSYGNLLVEVPRGEPILLTADPQFAEECFQRVECQTVTVTRDEIWWNCIVKHTSVRIETAYVDRKCLLKIQRRFGGETRKRSSGKPSAVHPAVQRIHDLLYLDAKNGREFYNPDKSWDADVISAIAQEVGKHIPRPR